MATQRISYVLLPLFLVTVSLVTSLVTVVGQLRPLPAALMALPNVDLDPDTAAQFSCDFGRIVRAAPPAAVLRPSSPDDIAALVRLAFSSSSSSPPSGPFTIAARGHGHSIRGQAFAPGGVVVDMESLRHGRRINVSSSAAAAARYVDAGGEQLWIDVLRATLERGVAPRSWTDYLHLTVGGTLSNAGISGQAFRHGPQISNVFELDVITGKGEMITCSPEVNPDLFHGALGGLGQLGVITRARIAVVPAPRRVRWVRLMYTEFAAFTRDQELLISLKAEEGFDYVEGSLLMDQTLLSNWRSSFFSEADSGKIKALAAESGGIYCLEAAAYYDYHYDEEQEELAATATSVVQKIEALLKQLGFVPGFAFSNDVSYVGFLDRVHDGELKLRAMGLWDVPHPWFNILVPKSRIHEFELGVMKGILKGNNSMGPVLIYPMNSNKWEEKMSAVIPNEEIFYSVGLLRSAAAMDDEWKQLDEQNDEILSFCQERGIEYKQYLPHYTSERDWMKHFGDKWERFVELKRRYDPKALLSPGQQIFTSSLVEDDYYL